MSESSKYIAKLEFESDDDFTFPLATNMMINFDTEHFYIRFFQASPPPVLGEEAPKTVKAKLVAGAAIPISKMEAVINALKENYERRLELSREDMEFDLGVLEDVEDTNE